MRRIFIFGCGGSGREMLQIIRELTQAGNQIEPVAFIVDPGIEAPAVVDGLPILRGFSEARQDPSAEVAIGLGSPAARRKVARRLDEAGLKGATLIHPRALIGQNVSLGPGTLVCANAVMTTDIRLGAHVHVNIAATVSHDSQLDDFATLAPGVHLAGNVVLEEGVEMGVGACAIPGIRIGHWAMIGGGATVTRDIPPNAVAVGVPAQEIRRRVAGWERLP
ncbi:MULTISPECIES: acetyltransferase [unclassified Aureimonas]|uniref:acetyltransferase n=1 Tax=unclassified Aureimonas TaxID=2615206 RepID=UPI0006F2ACF5|nr:MULTISPECIES: acetyltransferase [unclassified Aureimonas]KQT58713.1 hypothetical protein ASG62_24500 [Aureimonas sp. Leaf427]KQT63951.1 hypothetical protein ASG54_22865 [Aureimonas sp. Leaf460]